MAYLIRNGINQKWHFCCIHCKLSEWFWRGVANCVIEWHLSQIDLNRWLALLTNLTVWLWSDRLPLLNDQCVCFAVRLVLQFLGWGCLCTGRWGGRGCHSHLRHEPRAAGKGRETWSVRLLLFYQTSLLNAVIACDYQITIAFSQWSGVIVALLTIPALCA